MANPNANPNGKPSLKAALEGVVVREYPDENLRAYFASEVAVVGMRFNDFRSRTRDQLASVLVGKILEVVLEDNAHTRAPNKKGVSLAPVRPSVLLIFA